MASGLESFERGRGTELDSAFQELSGLNILDFDYFGAINSHFCMVVLQELLYFVCFRGDFQRVF